MDTQRHGGAPRSKKGKLNEAGLLTEFLRNPAISEIVARDELSAYDLMMHAVPDTYDDRIYPRPWEDTDTLSLLVWLQKNLDPAVSDSMTSRTVKLLAVANLFNPLQRRLAAIEWDHRPRIDHFLTRALGLDTSDARRQRYHRAVSRTLVWAIVSRAMTPGCKFDCMPILEGGQGIGKSRFCRALALDEDQWFTDSLPPITNGSMLKDAKEMMIGKMIVEMAELAQFRGTHIEVLKTFLSTPVDTVRLPYAARSGLYRRSSVMMGTTNGGSYLTDVSGNRRFWPLACGTIDLDYVYEELEQVYAEAMHDWHEANGHLRLWLPEDIEIIAQEEQEARRDVDPLEDSLRDYIEECRVESVKSALWDGGGFWVAPMSYLEKTIVGLVDPADRDTNVKLQRVARILAALGGRAGQTTMDVVGEASMKRVKRRAYWFRREKQENEQNER